MRDINLDMNTENVKEVNVKEVDFDKNLDLITANIELEWDRLEKAHQKLELEKENLNKEKLKLEKKLGIHLFNSTVKKMFDNDEFVKSLDEKISEITKDGKVDLKDLPELMLIVLEVTDNLNKFNLTYDEILIVLEEFIMYIIETKNLVENKDMPEVNRLIKTVIKLTMARPAVSKWFKKIWDKVKSKLCCC